MPAQARLAMQVRGQLLGHALAAREQRAARPRLRSRGASVQSGPQRLSVAAASAVLAVQASEQRAARPHLRSTDASCLRSVQAHRLVCSRSKRLAYSAFKSAYGQPCYAMSGENDEMQAMHDSQVL